MKTRINVLKITEIKDVFRPGHADYTYEQKYGLRDYRGGGRSSARETAMRVAAGAIAKISKEKLGIEVRGYLSQLGPITCELVDWSIVESNPFFCPDPSRLDALDEYMRALKKRATRLVQSDCGGRRVPVGLGEPVLTD